MIRRWCITDLVDFDCVVFFNSAGNHYKIKKELDLSLLLLTFFIWWETDFCDSELIELRSYFRENKNTKKVLGFAVCFIFVNAIYEVSFYFKLIYLFFFLGFSWCL